MEKVQNVSIPCRQCNDMLVLTSLIYGLDSIIAAAFGDIPYATLLGLTCVGSTLYHRYREAR